MKKIPGGSYRIGTNCLTDRFISDNEGPMTDIQLTDFWIDETTVTNQAFQQFIEETGYQTEAEKFGWSFVFDYFLDEDTKQMSQTVPNLAWWSAVAGANWRHPEGPTSTIAQRMDHPVVQVSRNDALAYCQWAGKQLPTEAQWEVAAKGGTEFERYPWGEEFLKDNHHQCNIWQGEFPVMNTQADGFSATAPVTTYAPNGYGLYQMIGNVWEWCSNPARILLASFTQDVSVEFWQQHQQVNDEMYATRGGSFLCHESNCKRYRIAARNGNTGMSAANNLGFRCVKN